MKTISQLNLEKLKYLKNYANVLMEDLENTYQEVIRILGCEEDNGWVVDCFYNDTSTLEFMLDQINVEVNDAFVGDSDHEH